MLISARVLTNPAERRTIPVTEMKSFDELSPTGVPGREPEREDPSVDDDRPDVLLTGLLFYDLVLTGLGKPPTPGEEIWTGGMGCGPGGIANLAVAAARFGLRTSLATVFGDDLYGEYCRDVLCDQEDIDLSLSRTADGWPTPVTVSSPTATTGPSSPTARNPRTRRTR